jgi:hypothetical protein
MGRTERIGNGTPPGNRVGCRAGVDLAFRPFRGPAPGLRESASSVRRLAIGTSRADLARMPLAGGPQVGFPAGADPVEQSADDLRAEEGDQIGGDPAFEVERRTVLEAAAPAGLAHGAARHQHADGDAVAQRE